MLAEIPYLAVVALFGIGLYVVMFKRNLIKLAMGITLMEMGVNLFLITLAFRSGDTLAAPIFTYQLLGEGQTYSLPTPHALTLTSIVIGVATSAMMLSFAMVIYKKYGTVDIRKIRKLNG
jgi:multisubunit Na+/H+ antiporter MnhC subunit